MIQGAYLLIDEEGRVDRPPCGPNVLDELEHGLSWIDSNLSRLSDHNRILIGIDPVQVDTIKASLSDLLRNEVGGRKQDFQDQTQAEFG